MNKNIIFIIAAIIVFSWLITNSTTKKEKDFIANVPFTIKSNLPDTCSVSAMTTSTDTKHNIPAVACSQYCNYNHLQYNQLLITVFTSPIDLDANTPNTFSSSFRPSAEPHWLILRPLYRQSRNGQIQHTPEKPDPGASLDNNRDKLPLTLNLVLKQWPA